MTSMANETAFAGQKLSIDWRALADRHETIALELAQHMDGGSIEKAARHFTIANALRAKAAR